MKTTCSYRAGRAVLVLPTLILCSALLGGCSGYLVKPKALPHVSGYEGLPLSSVSLIVVNAEKDNSEQDILTVDKERSGFLGNRQAWSKRLVESLSRELAVRGAQLRSNASVVLSLSLPEITFSETWDQLQFTVKVVVSTPGGWKKEYEGVAASSERRTGSVLAEADRLAGQALADVIKNMLGDTQFIARLGSKQ